MKSVSGFLVSPDYNKIVLIAKMRPAWQIGMFNGVGGKMDKGNETPTQAMSREFLEETGLLIPEDQWTLRIHCYYPDFDCDLYFFVAASDRYEEVRSMTDEAVCIIDVKDLHETPLVRSVEWAIPMCLDRFIAEPVLVNYRDLR